jgi:hypothetical protein
MSTPRPPRKRLPVNPSIEHLKKQAKRIAARDPAMQLSDAQHQLAREYGFKNWAELAHAVETMSSGAKQAPREHVNQTLLPVSPAIMAVQQGDVKSLGDLIDKDPELVNRTFQDMSSPYGTDMTGATLLHLAVELGALTCVELLVERGALAWITDAAKRKPIDYALANNSLDEKTKQRIIHLIGGPRIDDENFREAVAAIDAGDVARLKTLLRDHPELATMHTNDPGTFAGPYFARPALIWFIAENPIRNGKLPANICEVAEAIIDAGAKREDIEYALGLVTSGCVPRQSGLQIPLIRTLVRRGANLDGALSAAVQEHEREAIDELLRLGAKPDLAAAAGLGRIDALREHLRQGPSDPQKVRRAVYNACSAGRTDSMQILLDHGLDVNLRLSSGDTGLHHAAWGGHGALVELLLARGADPTIRDSRFEATAAQWARHNGKTDVADLLQKAELSRH